MIDSNYARALTEVDIIIENKLMDFINLIPRNFIEFVKNNKQADYIFEFDKTKSIDNQNLMPETKAILTIIYRDFLCSEEEKNEINDILIANENKSVNDLKEKYNSDIFKRKNSIEHATSQSLAVVNKNTGLFHKLKIFLKRIFKRT